MIRHDDLNRKTGGSFRGYQTADHCPQGLHHRRLPGEQGWEADWSPGEVEGIRRNHGFAMGVLSRPVAVLTWVMLAGWTLLPRWAKKVILRDARLILLEIHREEVGNG